MGKDKLNMLKNFNLELLFLTSRATKIRELWDKFLDLYNDLRKNDTNPDNFEKAAKEWLTLFLSPSIGDWMVGEEIVAGLYLPSDVTPYIHVLVYHVSDMMRNHKNWGVKGFFLCSSGKEKSLTCILFLS